ncbi:MAG: hypothetical protein DRP58_07640, partial [Spirochaetes bacterium]
MANGTVRFNKEGIVVADIVFGMGLVVDSRGSQEQFNASHLPYSGSESVAAALLARYTKVELDGMLASYALLHGDSSSVFNVATGTDVTHAVNKGQMEQLFSTGVQEGQVILIDGSSALLIPTMDSQPANKKYVDDTVVDIGAGDMSKSVYDNNNNGIVDTSEALGVTSTFLGITPSNQVMRKSQSEVTDCNGILEDGIYLGTDIVNAPAGGRGLVEQFIDGQTKVQRFYSFATANWFGREFNSTWSLWKAPSNWQNIANVTVEGLAPVSGDNLARGGTSY